MNTDVAIPEGDFVVVASDKGGRPSKYTPENVNRLLSALEAGMTHKQACLACGISQSTLTGWREQYPELEPRMEEAREVARKMALEAIQTAGDKDWRAQAEWLRLCFPGDYRRDGSINVSATANAQQATVVVSEETRKRLQEKLRQIQESRKPEEIQNDS